jgi:hypothetical protein
MEHKYKSDTNENRSNWKTVTIIYKSPVETYGESRKSRKYRKQPYWTLNT